jgi:hypothetical protein
MRASRTVDQCPFDGCESRFHEKRIDGRFRDDTVPVTRFAGADDPTVKMGPLALDGPDNRQIDGSPVGWARRWPSPLL